MIDWIVGARRRLIWRRRLAIASCRLEIAAGNRNALWVFDSLRGPDGYSLRDHMHALAVREGLTLYAFGPFENGRDTADLSAFRGDFDRLLAERIASVAAKCNATLLLTGSAKGTFAAAIDARTELWEIQHGLLDASYLPLSANRFFVRSTVSREILERAGYGACLVTLSEDLSPPPVTAATVSRATSVVCYSKNPGGGCVASDLARFERAVIGMAKRRGLPVELRQHPRDSRAKLMARHRGIGILKYVGRKRAMPPGPRLLVSSYSTALTSESRPGDLLLNVALSSADQITSAEYRWLPTVSVDGLASIDELPAALRA